MRFSFAAVTFVFAAALTSAAIIPRRALNLSRVESRYFNDEGDLEMRQEDVPEINQPADIGYADAKYAVRTHPRHFPRAPVQARSEGAVPEVREIHAVRSADDDDYVVTVHYKRVHPRHFPKRSN